MTVVTYPEKNWSQVIQYYQRAVGTANTITQTDISPTITTTRTIIRFTLTTKLLQVKYFVSRVRQWLADSRADWRSNFQRPPRQRFTIIILWDIFTKEHIFIYEIIPYPWYIDVPMYQLIYNIFGLEIKTKTFTCIGGLPFYQYERRRIMIISTRTTSMSVNRF